MPVSIDIVPVTRIDKFNANDIIRFNNISFLQQSSDFDRHLYKSSEGNIYTSLIENMIIRSIPNYVRMGYKIAKAVRLSSLLQPIFPQLIALGLTDDIHNIVRTYMLKTCIFYLVNAKQVADGCKNPICWAILIFSLLRHCLIVGELWEYFGNGHAIVPLFKCEHVSHESDERFFCCRQRKARLLILDRLVGVLKDHRAITLESDEMECTPRAAECLPKDKRIVFSVQRWSMHHCDQRRF